MHTAFRMILTFCLPWVITPGFGELVETDICIYGGTSGGVAAAVQAKRMGKRVVLLEPGKHLGGLTSGGLGKTDTGNTGGIGGISNEFYFEMGRQYGSAGRRFTFEPHVAEDTYEDWIAENDILLYREQELATVRMIGKRITEIEMRNGNIFRARVFIDTTYEGDLMAGAGVSYAIGRESNSTYGETINGIRNSTPSHQFNTPTDPYIIPGDPGSGLLRYIEAGPLGTPGSGDDSVQAYNYRLCLTQTVSNQLPITQPPDYDAFDYELLRRYIDARINVGSPLSLGQILKIDAMPNGKTDINNQGAFSTDYIGEVDDFPEADFDQRAQIISNYQHYVQGLLYFLGNDPQVPTTIRTDMLSWGLCKDEFVDNGGWNHQIYVREARRMVSDYVMTQANCQGGRIAPKSIGLGSYTMDSHNCRRIVRDGFAHNEGDVQIGVPQPYPIAYDSIVPSTNECDNLLVTFCLSASHVAFGSCRMEPVFMITSQSAATAAAFAIDEDLAIQAVDYDKLRLQLLADQQVINWGPSGSPTSGVIVDNVDPEVTLVGNWITSSSTAGYFGSNYFHDGNVDQGTKSALFTPNLPAAGPYKVYLNWASTGNRASNAPVTINHDGGSFSTNVNQQVGGNWELMGSFDFQAGNSGSLLIETTGADGHVIADAVSWVSATNVVRPVVSVIVSDPLTTEGDLQDPATLVFTRSDPEIGAATNVTMGLSFSGSASTNEMLGLPAAVTIPLNENTFVLDLFGALDGLFETNEILTITLNPDPSYDLDPLHRASITLSDRPFDVWRREHFDAGQRANPAIAGPDADPEPDGMSNLFEFLGDFDPLLVDGSAALAIQRHTTNPVIRYRIHDQATKLPLQLQASDDLLNWLPTAPPITTTRSHPWTYREAHLQEEALRTYYRLAASLEPFNTGPAICFFSFDTDRDGSGGFDPDVTATTDNFPGTPDWSQVATATGTTGGSASFVDYEANEWLGSGNAGAPGHCLAWQPGSTGNAFQVSFSTVGLEDIALSFDLRSAQQAGGSAPLAFDTFTYDIGNGPQPIPGIDLTVNADNTFRSWQADLGHLQEIENSVVVTFTWTFEDLVSVPAESFRIDNLEIRAFHP